MRSLVQGKALSTVLVDGEDLVLVLEGQLSFRAMLDAKVEPPNCAGISMSTHLPKQRRLTCSLSLQQASGARLLPTRHPEQSAALVFVVKKEHDLIGRKHLFGYGPLRQIGVDQGNDRLYAELGIAPDHAKEILFLAIIERLENAIMIGKARKLIIEMPTEHREVERNTEKLLVAVASIGAGNIPGFVEQFRSEF